MTRARSSPEDRRARSRRRPGAAIALLCTVLPLVAAAPLPRGDPASRLPATEAASEYWDFVARFDSGHSLFARFMITNEGPGQKTGIAYGHFVEPDGTVHFFSNGRREGNWQIDPSGLALRVGSSALDLAGPRYSLQVHKKKKGVDIDLHVTPDGPALWDGAESSGGPQVDLLAASAVIGGSVWFRGMPAPVALSGRVGITHTWMTDSEPELALRRIDFYSLGPGAALYLRDFEAPDGTRSRWLALVQDGKTLFQTKDLEIHYSGRSPAQPDRDYPLPGTLAFRGDGVEGSVELGVGLVHHDPMKDIPQPFRFLLSFKLRPHRVWTRSVFEVTYRNGSQSLRFDGSGLASATFLNPNPPTT